MKLSKGKIVFKEKYLNKIKKKFFFKKKMNFLIRIIGFIKTNNLNMIIKISLSD
jgi:hypothetical protein